MVLPFAAGGRAFAGDLDSATQQSAWTTGFTPTWMQTSGSPAFGNAVVNTAYAHTGRIVAGRYQFNFGSTTNFGTGTNPWFFSLPVAAVPPVSNFYNVGSWSGLSGSTFFTGAAYINSSGALSLFVNNSNQSIHGTNPAVWTSSNYLQVSFQYESTS